MTHPTLPQLVADKKFREIDALIAEKVMGWTKSMGRWSPPNAPPEYNVYGLVPPKYSTDISAAWEIVKKIGRTGNNCFQTGRTEPGGKLVYCEFTIWNESSLEYENHLAKADTASLAICLAALKTVMND